MNTHLVIMAGGVGSRLWPVSTPELPKQFIDLTGCGRTLIQLTVDRFASVCPPENVWVVTSERYVSIVREQLPLVPPSQILAEPIGRNTAPCIAYASWKISKKDPEANIVVSPADAIVARTDAFASLISSALQCTAKSSAIVTVGIAPTRPETAYGYIQVADKPVLGELTEVKAFHEKPSLELAKEYLSSGRYFWNAGIFVWNVSTIISAIRSYAPQIASLMDALAPSLFTDREQEELRRIFPQCEKISIDYAVMEKADNIRLIAQDLGWSDLGNWSALRDQLPLDAEGNAVVGTMVKLLNCRNCIVHAPSPEPLALEGLDGYVVARREGRVLVCRLSEEQQIRELGA
ncbi:MAG: mannose-1-phosphate guanylyltransferase [Bacteroidales bacterium]|nr:mannose-1-phosphate guanylyltransferase [Bacteroidales bacterium]